MPPMPPKPISATPEADAPPATDAAADAAVDAAAPGTERPQKVRITSDGGTHRVVIDRGEGGQPAASADDDDDDDDDLGEPLSEPQAFEPTDVSFGR
uniref:Uncharacterized protein n=1 Tax=Prymnesium polylepis TaxID=72548 RepID=A0A7S4IRQ1_9EUKA